MLISMKSVSKMGKKMIDQIFSSSKKLKLKLSVKILCIKTRLESILEEFVS